MATKYWVGGNGNWSSLTNWRTTSGGAVITTAPGFSDAAVLDANSSTSVVTVDSNITIQTLTCTGFTGTLAFGTNTISVNSTGTVFTGDTTMTVTGTPQIILTNNSATARTITPTAVTEANSISFRITAGTGTLVTTAGSYRDLDFTDGTNPTGYAGALQGGIITVYGNFKASTGMTQSSVGNTITFAATSGTKTINTAGVTFDRPFNFNGVGGTWQLQAALTSGATRTITLTNGTLDLNGYTVTCGFFSSNNSNTRTLAFGSSGKLILSGSGGTIFAGTTSTGLSVTGTAPLVQFNYSGGTASRNIVMWSLPESQAISVEFLNNATDIVVLQGVTAGYKNIDVTNFNGTLQFANTPRCFGNLTLGSSLSSAVTGSTLTFAATSGTKTITLAGQTIDAPLTFNGVGGTWQLQDNFTQGSTRTLTLTNGTIDLNGKTFSTGTLQTAAGTKDITFNGGSLVITSSGTTAFNNAVPTGFTTTAGTGTGTISMNSASAKTFVGGSSVYNCTLSNDGAGTLTITGSNTFNSISNTVSPTSFVFTAGTTTTVSDFTVSGTAGNLVTIGSSTTSSATLSKSSGTVNVKYLSISYSTATGGAAWNAFTDGGSSLSNNNVNAGNNIGWYYIPTGATFMTFFQ